MNARYYNGKIGRFISQDPIFLGVSFDLLDPQSLNSYAYARNNPLRYIDPTGMAYIEAMKGFAVGFVEGIYGAGTGMVNSAFHPIDTIKNTAALYSTGISAGSDLYSSFANNSGQAFAEIKTGYGIAFEEFSALSFYDQGKYMGNGTAQVEIMAAAAKIGSELNSKPNVQAIKMPYSRPPNATTSAQKNAVQGFSCATCGKTASKMYADHKIPIVKEYYETGKIDLNRMRDVKSVQPQCPTCSNKQGGQLSNYSKQMKQKYGF